MITLALPPAARPGDVVAAFDATLAALAAGEIMPDEVLTVTRVLDARLRWDHPLHPRIPPASVETPSVSSRRCSG